MSFPVLAQTREALDPIIVTASFDSSPASHSGASVSLLQSDTLGGLGNPSITDFLRLTPSLSVSTSGPIGSLAQVRIRGAEANHTQVFIDGIEANDPAASGEYGFSESLSSAIDRIEVLRGPQSAMYGSEAIGGVISLFTRSPFDGSRLFADVSGGSFNTFSANGGGRWSDGVLGVSMSGGYHRTDGINISPAGTESDGSETLTLLGKIEARPGDRSRIGFTARYVEQRSAYDDTQFFDTTAPYVVDTPDLVQKSKRFYARGFGEFSSGSWTHLLHTSLVATRNRQRNGNPADNTDHDGGRFVLGLRSRMTLDSHALTIAVEHERESYHDHSAAFGGFSRLRQARTQTSAVGQYRLALADRVFADASVRQDWNGDFGDATTWRLTGSVLLGGGARLHASGGRGVTNPSFTEQFGFFPGSFVGNPALVPEQSTGWDAGVEWRNSWLRLDATWFSARLTNEITTSFDSAFNATPVNKSGRSKRDGLELSLELSLDARSGAFTFTGFYSYLSASEQASATAAATREIRRPEHQGAIAMQWSSGDLSAAAALSYTGTRLDDDFRSFPANRLTLPAYVLATVSGSYQLSSSVTAFARIENAFDARYQDVFGYRTAGLGAFAGLRLRLE